MERAAALLVVLLASATARAQGGGCPEAVARWVGEASRAVGTAMEPVQCPPGMVRIRLSPEGAPPMDVEVAEPPGPAFRHAGRFRTSPIVDVPDYGVLPEPDRRAYEALVAWIAAHEARVTLHGSDTAPARVAEIAGPGLRHAGLWLVGAALLLAAAGLARARPARVEWRPAAAVLAVAATVRLVLGVFGPWHINGQGPLWIRGAIRDPGILASYGPGYAELLGPLARSGIAPPDVAIFAANAALSALAPVLLYALARAADLDRHRALLAALLLACDPVSARLGASESYFAPIVTLVLGATLLGALAADRAHARRPLAAGALVLAASLLAVQAARMHPVAWPLVALLPLAGLLGGDGPPVRAHLFAAAAVAAVTAAAAWLTSGGWLASVAERSLADGPGAGVLSSLGTASSPMHVGVTVVLAAAALFVARPRAPVLHAAAHVLFVLVTRHAYGQSDVWQHSYDRLAAPALALGLAALFPRDLALRWAIPIPLLFAAAVFFVQGRAALERTTDQREYAFVRIELARLPADCRVAHVRRAGHRVLEIPDWAHPGAHAPLEVEHPDDLRTAAAAESCVFWLRTSICASEQARGLCDSAEARVSLDPPHARRTFPARPSYRALPYDRDPVPVTLRRAHSAAGPRRLSP